MKRGRVEGYFGRRDTGNSYIQEVFYKGNLDSTVFYPKLEDKLRQNNDSYNSKTLRRTYQSAVKMVETTLSTMDDFSVHVVEG